MHKWKYPKTYILPKERSETTDEELLKMEAELKKCNEHNETLLKSIISSHREMIALATFIFGEDSNPVKYLKKQTVNHPSHFSVSDLKRSVLNAKKEKESKTRELENDTKRVVNNESHKLAN